MDIAMTILLWTFVILMVEVAAFMSLTLFSLMKDAIFGPDEVDESESK